MDIMAIVTVPRFDYVLIFLFCLSYHSAFGMIHTFARGGSILFRQNPLVGFRLFFTFLYFFLANFEH